MEPYPYFSSPVKADLFIVLLLTQWVFVSAFSFFLIL